MSAVSGGAATHRSHCADGNISVRPPSLVGATGRALTSAWTATLMQSAQPVPSAAARSSASQQQQPQQKVVRVAVSSVGSRARSSARGKTPAVLADALVRSGASAVTPRQPASSVSAGVEQKPPERALVMPKVYDRLGHDENDPDDKPPAGVTREEPRRRCMRQFESAPAQQSIVDQVVFGRDMDFSGATQYDEAFISLFEGYAGRGTWERPSPLGSQLPSFCKDQAKSGDGPASARVRSEGRRVYKQSPTLACTVDQVIFGRGEGDTGHSEGRVAEDTGGHSLQFDGAGRPSHLERTQGLRTYGLGGPLADIPHSGNTHFVRKALAGRAPFGGQRRGNGRAAAKVAAGH